jgi:hypothetical protein
MSGRTGRRKTSSHLANNAARSSALIGNGAFGDFVRRDEGGGGAGGSGAEGGGGGGNDPDKRGGGNDPDKRGGGNRPDEGGGGNDMEEGGGGNDPDEGGGDNCPDEGRGGNDVDAGGGGNDPDVKGTVDSGLLLLLTMPVWFFDKSLSVCLSGLEFVNFWLKFSMFRLLLPPKAHTGSLKGRV